MVAKGVKMSKAKGKIRTKCQKCEGSGRIEIKNCGWLSKTICPVCQGKGYTR